MLVATSTASTTAAVDAPAQNKATIAKPNTHSSTGMRAACHQLAIHVVSARWRC
jgi:hypothetical protein